MANYTIRIFVLALVFIFQTEIILAQKTDDIKLNKLYQGTLDKVLDTISASYGVKFQFDVQKLKKIKIDDRPINKSLSLQLSQWCDANALKWYADQNGLVFVISKYDNDDIKIRRMSGGRWYKGAPSKYNYALSGKIIDKSSREALPFASIIVFGTALGTSTNADGYFSLPGVPCDTSTILVSYMGYKKTFYFLYPDLPVSNLVFELEPEGRELEEVSITAERKELMYTGEKISTIQMSPRKLDEIPNVGERDILRSFHLMPGVSGANEGSSGLYVRGATPDQNLILYDGFTVYHVDHLYGFFSAFNSNAIKDVQLYKGGFESKFGGRLASVTEITGKDGNATEFNIGGDISLLSANAYIEIPLNKKWTTLAAFRRSYRGPIYNKIFEQYNEEKEARQGPGNDHGHGPDFESDVTSYFYDLNVKVSFKPNEKDIFSLSLFNGTDKLDYGVKMEAPPFMANQGISFNAEITDLTKYGNLGSSFKWSRKWNQKFYGNTLVSYSRYYSSRERNDESMTVSEGQAKSMSGTMEENNSLGDISMKNDYTWNYSKVSQLAFGAALTRYDIDYTYIRDDTSKIINQYENGILSSAYVQNKFKFFNDRAQFVPGLRYSWFTPSEKFYFEPRLWGSLNFTDEIKIIGSVGRFYQFANKLTREDIMSGNRDFWILSNDKTIPVSSAVHYIGGLSYSTVDYLFSAEAYFKTMKDISEYAIRFQGGPGQQGNGYQEYFHTGKGFAKGIEFLAQKKNGKLNGWVSYTLGQARNQFDVYGSTYFNASQDVTHEFKIVTVYKFKRWNFSSTWMYATGRPYTAPEGSYTITLLDGNEQNYISAGSKNGQRLPAYQRLDISANYNFKSKDGEKERGSIGFSIFNVYNHKNTWYKEYQIVEDQIIETDKQFLGITPNITLTFKLH